MNNRGGRHLKNLTNSIISVRIQTRASKNEITEIQADGKIKIRLTAPPVEGLANKELIKLLGKVLETAPSNIEIVSGLKSREKIVAVAGIDSQTIYQHINEFILENK